MPRKKKESEEENMTPTPETPAPEIKEPKEKKASSLDKFAALAKKKWGSSVAIASELAATDIPRFSTGNLALDIATFGGLPQGRIVRMWGQPKSAKTGSALNAAAEVQKYCAHCLRRSCNCKNREPANVLWVDAEGRSNDNLTWMLSHGIDPDHIQIVSPSCGEEAVDIIDAAIRQEDAGFGLIVLDSIANIVATAELKKEAMDGETMGRNAKLMNSAFRKWTAALNARGVGQRPRPTLILLNQIRQKTDGYGDPSVLPGGMGQGFATSLDIKFTKRTTHYLYADDNGKLVDHELTGNKKFEEDKNAVPDYAEVEFQVTESSVCPKGRHGTFHYWLRPAHGHRVGDTDNADTMYRYAKEKELFKKESGGYVWKHLKETTLEKLKMAFLADPAMQETVWNDVLDVMKK